MNSEQRSELHDLFLRLAEGDRTAFTPVFQRLFPLVLGFCTRLLDSRDQAEDAAQETMIRLFAQISAFDPAGDALAWALSIAFWQCRTIRQERIRRDKHLASASLVAPASGESAEDLIASRALAATLNELLDRLPADQRRAIEATLLGETSGVAAQRKRKQRAVTQLRRWWRILQGEV